MTEQNPIREADESPPQWKRWFFIRWPLAIVNWFRSGNRTSSDDRVIILTEADAYRPTIPVSDGEPIATPGTPAAVTTPGVKIPDTAKLFLDQRAPAYRNAELAGAAAGPTAAQQAPATAPPPAPPKKSSIIRRSSYRARSGKGGFTPHKPDTRIMLRGRVPKIFIGEWAYDKMAIIVDQAEEEIGWLGIVDEIPGKGFLIRDVWLFEQEVHGAMTNITVDGLARFVEAHRRQPEGREVMNKTLFWGHSHVNFECFPSPQDDRQMENLRRSGADYFIRGIFNKKGSAVFDIYFFDIGVEIKDVEWEKLDEIDPTAEEEVRREIDELVTSVGRGGGWLPKRNRPKPQPLPRPAPTITPVVVAPAATTPATVTPPTVGDAGPVTQPAATQPVEPPFSDQTPLIGIIPDERAVANTEPPGSGKE